MKPKFPRHQSYLLRCWEEHDSTVDLPMWRFSLVDPRTGVRQGFQNLTALVVALHTMLFAPEQPGDSD